MNKSQVETFIKLKPQIESAYEEIGLLSKKNLQSNSIHSN